MDEFKSPSPRADFGRALQELNAPAYVVGADGDLWWLNATALELLGDRTGTPFLRMVDPQDRRLARENFARKLVGRGNRIVEVFVRGRDGERVRLRVTSAPLRHDDRIIGALVIALPLQDEVITTGRPPTLTPRQMQVLRLLGDGLETAEIAAELNIARETARNHIRAVLRALGAHSRLEAVVLALSHGLLSPPAVSWLQRDGAQPLPRTGPRTASADGGRR